MTEPQDSPETADVICGEPEPDGASPADADPVPAAETGPALDEDVYAVEGQPIPDLDPERDLARLKAAAPAADGPQDAS